MNRRKAVRRTEKRVVQHDVIPIGEKDKEPPDWIIVAINRLGIEKKSGRFKDGIDNMKALIYRSPLIACFFLPVAYSFVLAFADIIRKESGKRGVLNVR